MRKLPPLSAVRVFEAAARHESFTRAAEELGMTQAAVSYQVKLLEERLGAPLFTRLPRQVVLTALGRRLAPPVTDAFETLRTAFATLGKVVDNVLSLTVLPTIAAHWLVPRLGRFQLAHPQLAVQLDASQHVVDLQNGQYDIGIRSGLGDWPDLDAHFLLPSRFTPVCSPALAKPADIRSPVDILKLPLIGPSDRWWMEWFATAGLGAVDLSDRPITTLGSQQFEAMAAVAGQGVAMLNPFFFADELASGRLVQLSDLVMEDERGYWLVYPKARGRLPKIQAFRDWALGEAARDTKQGKANLRSGRGGIVR
jgi:LysR family transcriptional regulator, glycine cleavage system transcriptional activator